MVHPDVTTLIARCERLSQEIELFVQERRRSRPTGYEPAAATAGGEPGRTILALIRDLRDSGFDDRYLSQYEPDLDSESGAKWQAASEARDFVRTGQVDEPGMTHLGGTFGSQPTGSGAQGSA